MSDETRICKLCKIPQPLDSFRVMGEYRRRVCKGCVSIYRKAKYAANPEKEREASRKWWREHPAERVVANSKPRLVLPRRRKKYRLKYLYKISEAEYQVLVERQAGRCAICKRQTRLCIDHFHGSDPVQVRGLLCRPCNTYLGVIKESQETLSRALEYLRKFSP